MWNQSQEDNDPEESENLSSEWRGGYDEGEVDRNEINSERLVETRSMNPGEVDRNEINNERLVETRSMNPSEMDRNEVNDKEIGGGNEVNITRISLQKSQNFQWSVTR